MTAMYDDGTSPTTLHHSSSMYTPGSISSSQHGPNTTDTHLDVDAYLQELSDRMAVMFLPAILTLGIMSIIGTIGNAMVIYVYVYKFKPSSTRSAIVAIASFDLVASCFSMPGEIFDLRHYYTFHNEAFCKAFRVATTVIVLASDFTLLVVAYDRYRRICHPMREQLAAGEAKKRVVICLIIACICSIPSAIIYGLTKAPTAVEGVYGEDCAIAQKYHGHVLLLIDNIFHTVIFFSVTFAFTVLYSLICRAVLTQSRRRVSLRGVPTSKQDENMSSDSAKDAARRVQQLVIIEMSKSETSSDSTSIQDVVEDPSRDATPDRSSNSQSSKQQGNTIDERKKSTSSTRRLSIFQRSPLNGDVRTRKTTLMLFIMTIAFVLSFIPYLIMKGLQATNKGFPRNESTTGVVIVNICGRSYFLNSVVNCFIYGFCSAEFRKEVKLVLLNIFCFCKKK